MEQSIYKHRTKDSIIPFHVHFFCNLITGKLHTSLGIPVGSKKQSQWYTLQSSHHFLQLSTLVQLLRVISASDALSSNKHIGNG